MPTLPNETERKRRIAPAAIGLLLATAAAVGPACRPTIGDELPPATPTPANSLFPVAPIAATAPPSTPSVPIPGAMVTIPGGSFKMGHNPPGGQTNSDEWPEHAVTVASFQMDVTEVTVAAYRGCMKAGACKEPSGGFDGNTHNMCNIFKTDRENHPINCLSYDDATSFCKWAGKRLPTEEEWEYAARGGSEGRTYPWGEHPEPVIEGGPWKPSDLLCWNRESHMTTMDGGTCPVGSHPKSSGKWGLVDMAGNVDEWTSSVYSTDYKQPRNMDTHVRRGGDYANFAPTKYRGASRHQGIVPYNPSGVRCAK